MHAPYRIAQPPEPERTEEADSYEALLLAGRKRYWAQMALFIAGTIAIAWLAVMAARRHPSGAEAARRQEALRIREARETVRAARAEVDRAQRQFDDALHLALDRSLGPKLPLEACPIALGDPDRLVRGRAMIPLLVVRDTSAAHYWSPSIGRAAQDVATAESILDSATPAAAVTYADALAMLPVHARLTRDVVLVVSRWQAPVRSSVTEFEPGTVDGLAYVYDFNAQRIVCAGEVHASNSRALEYTWNDAYDARGMRLDQTLEDDLDRQIARAVAEPGALYRVGGLWLH